GTVHRGRVLLRAVQLAWLKRANGPIGGFGQVEDDGVRVELRRGVAVHRPRAVVFEERRHEIASRLRSPIATEPRLHVPLQLVERDAHTLAVSLAYAVVAPDECGDRHALRRRERRVPPGTMLHRRDGLSTDVLRLMGGLV